MNYTMLGADQTVPQPYFVRIISPNALQKSANNISRYILDKYPGIDIFNLSLHRKLGLDGGKVLEWLSRYVQIARKLKKPLDENTIDEYIQEFKKKYNYRDEDLSDYFEAFMETKKSGLIDKEILSPWTYKPKTVAEDIVDSILPKVVLIGIAGVIAYGLSTSIIPQVAKAAKKT